MILSPIDKPLGGEALVGMKTILAVVAYAILSVLQALGVIGTASGDKATIEGQVLTVLILTFGAFGLLAKIDRLAAVVAHPPILSPIDKVFGGEALVGKKTTCAVVAYAILSLLQVAGVIGTASGDTATRLGEVLSVLILAFGAWGLLAKIDRIAAGGADPPALSPIGRALEPNRLGSGGLRNTVHSSGGGSDWDCHRRSGNYEWTNSDGVDFRIRSGGASGQNRSTYSEYSTSGTPTSRTRTTAGIRDPKRSYKIVIAIKRDQDGRSRCARAEDFYRPWSR